MRTFIKISVFLLLLSSLSGNVGYITPETNHAITIVLFLSLILLDLSFRVKLRYLLFSLPVLSLIIYFIIISSFPQQLKPFFIFALCLLSFNIILKETEDKKLNHIFLLTTFFYLSFLIFYYFVPEIWLGLQKYAHFISNIMANLFKSDALFGSTTIGLPIIILIAIFILTYYIYSRQKSILNLFVSLFALLIAHILTAPLQILLTDLIKNKNSFSLISPMDLLIVPFLLSLVSIYLLIRRTKTSKAELKDRRLYMKYFYVALGFLFISIVFLTFPELNQQKNQERNVFIYSKGIVTWNKPEFGRYGLRSGGMFGMLPEYLKSLGYSVVMDSVINNKNLQKANTLVVINLDKNFSEPEKNTIIKFVGNGGSLCVLGDHTSLSGIRKPLNDLLKFTGIELNFDSAHYLKQDWRHSFELLPHPITHKIKSNAEIGISVGASLSIPAGNAVPLITAKFGFSDWGNALNRDNAYLGDRRYNDGELLGDIILVAKANYGKGKVLVFGDTSSLQNGVLCRNFKFVDQTFNWLTSYQNSKINRSLELIGIIAFILAFIMLVIADFVAIGNTQIIYLFTVLLLALFITDSINPKYTNKNISKGKIAYIDLAHLERFEIYGDHGIWSLTYNLMRNGYLPYIERQFSVELLNNSTIYIVISPAKFFSNNEIELIDKYIKNGGNVIWAVGYEEKESSLNLLQQYGMDLDNLPLGYVPKDQTDQKVGFSEAWPILLNEKKDNSVICTAWDLPTIVSKKIEKGRFILIADSYFLLSKNLEHDNGYYEENIFFLKSIFEGL